MCFWDSAAFRRRRIVTPSELGVSGAWSGASLSVEAGPPRASGGILGYCSEACLRYPRCGAASPYRNEDNGGGGGGLGWIGERGEQRSRRWMHNRNQHCPGKSYPRTGEVNKAGVEERKECKTKNMRDLFQF